MYHEEHNIIKTILDTVSGLLEKNQRRELSVSTNKITLEPR